MKINAVIENKDGGTLVLDFPRSIYDVYEKIQSVGIRKSPHLITLSDEEGNDVRVKQVAAICLTAFMQTTLLFLGLLTFPDHMLLGLGIMLAANEVPRIAQQFGLDSSVKVNMMSVVHATTTAVNLTRSVARATGK